MKYVVAYADGFAAKSIHREERGYGDTIQEIVDSMECLPKRFAKDGAVFINGEQIPRENWSKIRPRATEEVPVAVTLHIAPQFGGGGGGAADAGKGILSLLTGGLSTPLSFFGSSLLGSLAKLALSIGASLLMNALSKPPKPKKEKQESGSKTSGLEGNVLEPGASIPRVIGTHKIFPPFIVNPLVSIDGQDEYAEGVLALSGPHKLDEIKAGDVDINITQDVTFETREGWPTDTAITTVTRQSYTDTNQITISDFTFLTDEFQEIEDFDNSTPIWHSVTTRKKPDEFWIHFALPNGLYDGDEPTSYIKLPLRIRFRKKGSTAWINLPELYFSSRKTKTIKFEIKFIWGSQLVNNTQPPTNNGYIYAFGITPAQTVAPIGTQWIANQYFRKTVSTAFVSTSVLYKSNYATSDVKNIQLSEYSCCVYLDQTIFPKDIYEFSVKRGFATKDLNHNYNLNGQYLSPFSYRFRNGRKSINNLSGNILSSATNGTTIIIVNDTGESSVTLNGKIYETYSTPTVNAINEIIWDGTRFVAAGLSWSGYSLDGKNWTTIAGSSVAFQSIAFNGTIYVGVGNGFSRILNTITGSWVAGGAIGAATYLGITSNGNRFVAVGSGGNIRTSDDNGTSWISRVSGTVNQLNDVEWTGTEFVAVGNNGTIIKSSNGITWSSVVSPTVNILNHVEYFSGTLAIGGANGTLYTSTNSGTSWTLNNLNSTDTVRSITVANNIWVAVGNNSYAGYSKSLPTWYNYDDYAEIFESQENRNSETYLIRAASVWNEHPCPVPNNLAMIAVRSKNRQLSEISTLASGYVKDWNGASWSNWTTTSNPAPHYFDALAGSLNFDPLPASIIDNTSLVNWRTRCSTKGYNANMIVEGRTMTSLLETLAGCGYARAYKSEVWGVVQDDDKSAQAPVQVFTPKNSRNFKFAVAFNRPTDAFRVTYRDSTSLYLESQFIEYDTFNGHVPNVANPRIEQMTYDGLVTEAEAQKRAKFDLAQARLRNVIYTFDADIESILCRQGDLVAVQHDVIQTQSGFSRIKTKTVAAGNITSVTTYEALTLGAGPNAVSIRHFDGSITTHQIAQVNGSFTTITFVTPFTNTTQVDDDALIVSGASGTVYKRLLVTSIQPSSDFTATMTLVDEAPSLQTII